MNRKELISQLANNNDRTYNILKVIEECSELATILTQYLTKGAKEKDITDEIGDVDFRLKILKNMFNEEIIKKRVDYKFSKCEEYINEGKYKNCV